MFETQVDDRPRLHLVACHTGETLDVPGPNVLVGRHSDADLRLPSCDVSRRHCRFVHRDGGWRVIDLASLNGTFVNDARVEEAEVHPGDHIRISNFVFELIEGESRDRQILRQIGQKLDDQLRQAS